MGLLSRLLGREQRGASIKSDGFLGQFFNMRGVGSISPDEVLSNMAVATACVSRRSQGLAAVPLNIHRNVGTSNAARAEDHPLYDLLNYQPNDYQSAFEFREFLVRSHDAYGNAYARIEWDARGVIVALHPFAPWNVSVERLTSGRLRYRATDAAGKVWVLLEGEILHVRGPSRDGVIGLSPIQIAAGALGLARSYAETAQVFSDNRLSAGGVYSIEGNLDERQHAKLLAFIKKCYTGPRNAWSPLILDRGAKFTSSAVSPLDGQLLESRKYANEDVARIFDCPPTSVGLVDRSTFSNVEQEAIALVQNCYAPLGARFESAFARCLLTHGDRRRYFIRHDFTELLRGDIRARFESYRLAREMGVYSPNDVRRLENEAPIEGGDVYHVPVNWAPLGAVPIGHNGGPPLGDGATGANG